MLYLKITDTMKNRYVFPRMKVVEIELNNTCSTLPTGSKPEGEWNEGVMIGGDYNLEDEDEEFHHTR